MCHFHNEPTFVSNQLPRFLNTYVSQFHDETQDLQYGFPGRARSARCPTNDVEALSVEQGRSGRRAANQTPIWTPVYRSISLGLELGLTLVRNFRVYRSTLRLRCAIMMSERGIYIAISFCGHEVCRNPSGVILVSCNRLNPKANEAAKPPQQSRTVLFVRRCHIV